ncbi:hypothetical protein RB653_001675 [Dictyostelium firmibasis]|uniref:IPT/TIG domain-containing protein n=1 Tax=Dictyostelium firmibasis TaxID=79012 RepID=A0AAN7U7P0_9MYCE
MKLIYPPIIEYVNSIPRNKNGIITIKGTRLVSNIQHSNIEVRIGSLTCTIITKFSHEITCNLVSNGCNETNLLINLKVGDIVNSDAVYFNFDTPFISSYSIKNDVLILNGHCFGNKESIIFNDDIPLIFENVNVNEEETIMSLTIPRTLKYLNLSIKPYQTKSNYFFIGLSFISKFVTFPLVNGSICIVKLFNTSYDSIDSPLIIVNPSTKEENNVIGIMNEKFPNDVDFKFFIGAGCGIKNYIIKLGNQSYPSTFYYRPPIIESCFVKEGLIKCKGDFNNIGFENETIINFLSNETIVATKITPNEIIFDKKPHYVSGYIEVCCCGIISDPFFLSIEPTIKNTTSSPFDYFGGQIYVIGPVITNVSSINFYKNHWLISIYGFNFYLSDTTININGNDNCSISYKIPTRIECTLDNETLKTVFLPNINGSFYFNITTNHKSFGSNYTLVHIRFFNKRTDRISYEKTKKANEDKPIKYLERYEENEINRTESLALYNDFFNNSKFNNNLKNNNNTNKDDNNNNNNGEPINGINLDNKKHSDGNVASSSSL